MEFDDLLGTKIIICGPIWHQNSRFKGQLGSKRWFRGLLGTLFMESTRFWWDFDEMVMSFLVLHVFYSLLESMCNNVGLMSKISHSITHVGHVLCMLGLLIMVTKTCLIYVIYRLSYGYGSISGVTKIPIWIYFWCY